MASADIRALETWLSEQIIGQEHLVQRLLIALLSDGHLLVEGAPGLAKTRAIKSLAEGVERAAEGVGMVGLEGLLEHAGVQVHLRERRGH